MRVIEQIEYIVNHTPENDTNHRIAETILDNLSKLQQLSLAVLAERCFVSTSTLMRFFKAAGYASYPLFQAAVQVAVSDFIYHTYYVPRASLHEGVSEQPFLDALIAQLSQLRDGIENEQLRNVCRAMHDSSRVVFLGVRATSTLNLTVLRSALCLTGVQTRLREEVIPQKPEDFVTEPEDLCCFFREEGLGSQQLDNMIVRAKEQGSRVLVISNVRKFARLEDCDFALCFDGMLSYVDHHSMQALIAMLAITYRELYMEEIRRAGK